MSKACQYAINHNQVCNGMHELNLKDVQLIHYSMDKKIMEGVAKVGKGMCQGFFIKKEIENTRED
jgi:hypothetical protein